MTKRDTYRQHRAELGELSLDQLRELNDELTANPNDPRGDDELYVQALTVSINSSLPRRRRSR